MIVNRFAGDKIAREFSERLESLRGLRKAASHAADAQELSPAQPELSDSQNPADFLVEDVDETPISNKAIDDEISSLSEYSGDDEDTEDEGFLISEDDETEEPSIVDGEFSMSLDDINQFPYEDMDEFIAKDPDFDDLGIDKESAEGHILHGLSKIAESLRGRGEKFAADMVDATASGIKDDLIKEASKRRNILNGLDKIAKELHDSGHGFGSDLVKTTIRKISKR